MQEQTVVATGHNSKTVTIDYEYDGDKLVKTRDNFGNVVRIIRRSSSCSFLFIPFNQFFVKFLEHFSISSQGGYTHTAFNANLFLCKFWARGVQCPENGCKCESFNEIFFLQILQNFFSITIFHDAMLACIFAYLSRLQEIIRRFF